MTTLIQVQEEAIRRMMQPRTSEKRHTKLRASVRDWYVRKLVVMWECPRENALATWKDVLDMWRLQVTTEE